MSTKPANRGGGATWAVSSWPLRRKVALALAIPLLLAATLGGLRVQSDLAEASNASASAEQVTALRPAIDYLVAAERAMVLTVGTGGGNQAALKEALADIATAGDELLAAKESAGLTADQRYQVDAVLDLSQALRAEDAITLSPGTWVAQLRQLQSGMTQLITTIVNEQISPEPRLELLSQTLAGRFSLAMQQALVATERTGETGSLELFSELGVEGAAIDRLANALSGSESAVASLRTANAQRFRTVRTGGTDLGGPKAYADYDRIIGSLQEGIDDELAATAADARAAAFVNAGITLAALLAAVLLAFLVSRLLLNPIRRVREGALAVAHERLPEVVARIRAGDEPGEITPIDVSTDEEIGQLARAVDDLHRQAVVLASGEAGLRAQVSQMFVTLSRRSTSLINQQLGLIERLERDEEDPKRLENLFRLDHLAARMRRTADSLLILADAPTATAGVDGLTVSDALQAATSGVQDYQRVRIRSANAMRLDDGAAADVVHLLTELVDNALAYSPPTSPVTIGSTTTPGGVLIEIADAGLGIPDEQLAQMNDSLASGGEVTPDTARRMGLFVVSRLSRRYGLTTSLRANDEGGTTALVMLPPAVLPDLAPPPAPRAPQPAPEPIARETERPRPAERSDRKRQKQDRQPEPAMDIEARIDAALGLLSRIPGGTLSPGSGAPAPVTPSTAPAALAALRPLRDEPDQGPDPEPAAPTDSAPADSAPADPMPAEVTPPAVQPVVRLVPAPVEDAEPVESAKAADTAQPAESVEPDRPADVPVDPVEGPAARLPEQASIATDLPTRRPNAADMPVAAAPAPVVPRPRPAPEPAPAPDSIPAPAPARAHLTAVPQPSASALDGDWTDPGDDGFDTPIFRSLRSAWLSAGNDTQPWRTSEIEAGWEIAEAAEAPVEQRVSESGLPLRRPGSRLVPGGVDTTPTVRVRDPEAIRARLAAHASGVSRGRAAAGALHDSTQKEAGSR